MLTCRRGVPLGLSEVGLSGLHGSVLVGGSAQAAAGPGVEGAAVLGVDTSMVSGVAASHPGINSGNGVGVRCCCGAAGSGVGEMRSMS